MTITIKLERLVQSNASLLELGAVTTIPPKTAYTIGRVIRKTRDEVMGWNEQRQRVIREALKDNPKALKAHPAIPGEIWVDAKELSLEQGDAMNKAIDELGSVDVTIEAQPIKLDALGAATQVKPAWLADLDWLITDQ